MPSKRNSAWAPQPLRLSSRSNAPSPLLKTTLGGWQISGITSYATGTPFSVINGGGVPQKNETLNRVYANVLNKPVLVPEDDVTSLGSAIMAFMAAGAFESIEQAQQALCPRYRTVQPDAGESRACEQLYALYRKLYFAFGKPGSEAVAVGDVLPALRTLAATVRQIAAEGKA